MNPGFLESLAGRAFVDGGVLERRRPSMFERMPPSTEAVGALENVAVDPPVRAPEVAARLAETRVVETAPGPAPSPMVHRHRHEEVPARPVPPAHTVRLEERGVPQRLVKHEIATGLAPPPHIGPLSINSPVVERPPKPLELPRIAEPRHVLNVPAPPVSSAKMASPQILPPPIRPSPARVETRSAAAQPQPRPVITPRVREVRVEQTRTEEKTIQVTIGRIEIRATPQASLPKARAAAAAGGPKLDLDDYLSARARGRR